MCARPVAPDGERQAGLAGSATPGLPALVDSPGQREIESADPAAVVARSLHRAAAVLLAVSGGRDSMALMRAAADTAPGAVRAVATFDHGTGAHASAGAALVDEQAARAGFTCYTARGASTIERSEAAWRHARWRFLRECARRCGARLIVTAHTRDDHIETVVMRILRGAGARGIAALDIDGDVIHPWLETPRRAVADYAEHGDVTYVEDPSNASRAHLRNRVRLDLLPALRAARPGIEAELLALAADAAAWRRGVEELVGRAHPLRPDAAGVSVAAHDLTQYDAASLCVVWPVLAAQAGVTLDRRGIARLVAFTHRGRLGAVIQLSGGVEVQRSRFSFVLRRPVNPGHAGVLERGLRLANNNPPAPVVDR